MAQVDDPREPFVDPVDPFIGNFWMSGVVGGVVASDFNVEDASVNMETISPTPRQKHAQETRASQESEDQSSSECLPPGESSSSTKACCDDPLITKLFVQQCLP